MAIGLDTCLGLFPGVEEGGARPHCSGSFEVYFDRQHNEVAKNIGNEGRLTGSPLPI